MGFLRFKTPIQIKCARGSDDLVKQSSAETRGELTAHQTMLRIGPEMQGTVAV